MLWKLYFGLMACLVGFGLVGSAIEEEGHAIYPLMDYIALPVTAVQTVGLYGYAFRRPLLSERFWQLAVPVFALNLIASIVIGGVRVAADRDVSVIGAMIVTSLFALPLFLPLLWANRRYAFASPAIWKERSGDASEPPRTVDSR